MKMIVAVDKDFNILKDYYTVEYLEWWHEVLGDSNVVIGRRSFELLDGKILGRTNFVLSRHFKKPRDKDIKVINKPEKVGGAVIGGASTFTSYLPLVDEIYLWFGEGESVGRLNLKDFTFNGKCWERKQPSKGDYIDD